MLAARRIGYPTARTNTKLDSGHELWMTLQKDYADFRQGMRSHHIEMAYQLASAARCTPQQRILHVLVSLLCITGRSERPSSRYARVLATEGTDGIESDRDEAEAEGCPQEESVRTVLTSLGIPEADLQGSLHIPGVYWSGGDSCAVVDAIHFTDRRDLGGSLHPEISKLTELVTLDLDNTNISGSLEVLANNTQLWNLQLRHTRVGGRLEDLPLMAKRLQNLALTGTEVTGDVAALANATGLTRLCLSNTAVSGELKSLVKLDWLTELDLSNTAVSGELKSLVKLKWLEKLDLSNTAVLGELSSLPEMKGLTELDLSNTAVSGELQSLTKLERLERLDLANLKVVGDAAVMAEWSKIEHIDISGTEVEFVKASILQQFQPFNRAMSEWKCPLAALRFLDVSRTPQFSLAKDLLRPFAGCGKLATLKAAGSGLTGPLWPVIVNAWGFIIPTDQWPLSQALSVLDFASNNVTDVAKLPGSCRTLVLTGNPGVSFGAGAVEKAIKDVVFIDLRNATFANPSEARDLLDAGVVKANNITRTVFNQTHGFACYDLMSTSLQVSPDYFAADRLCDCSPGWNGSGAQCQKCPVNTFSDVYSSGKCNPCPTGSQSSEGSTSRSSCSCEVGVLDNSTGKCGCPKDEAKSSDICVKCQELFLNCSKPGAEVHSASPLPNYTRLGNESRAYKCLPPASRCNANLSDPGGAGCAAGYAAPMCIQCNHDYFSHGQQCERCRTSNVVSSAVVVAAVLVLAGLGAAFIWHRRNTEGHPTKPSCWTALAQQAKAQVPILLQLCQLWTILAVLASTLGSEGRDASKVSEYWEIPYIQTLQLSISSLKDTGNLQCKFDGGWIRFTSAMASPVLPLIVLLLCLVPELVKPGSGIAAGLQVVTLLYIGGASSTSGLLSCQETDGAGDSLPKAFAYRKLMPDIFCHQESQLKYRVDTLAFGCAFCYGILIPCCLLYLYGKQHMVLEVNRTRTVNAGYQGDLHLWLHDILGSTTQKISGKDEALTRPLIAAASAYISVLYRGRVQVQVVDGTAIVKQLGTDEGNDLPDLDLLSFVRVEDAKQRAKQLNLGHGKRDTPFFME
eukprot:symbB.v1.2.024965.t1/scaffold2399.1/size80101/1